MDQKRSAKELRTAIILTSTDFCLACFPQDKRYAATPASRKTFANQRLLWPVYLSLGWHDISIGASPGALGRIVYIIG